MQPVSTAADPVPGAESISAGAAGSSGLIGTTCGKGEVIWGVLISMLFAGRLLEFAFRNFYGPDLG